MKKIIFCSILLSLYSYSDSFIVEDLSEPKIDKEIIIGEVKKAVKIKLPELYKEQTLESQLEYLSSHKQPNRIYEMAVYFGNLLIDHPEYTDQFVKVFKYSVNKKIPSFSIKYAKIKGYKFKDDMYTRIPNSLDLKKYYDSSLQILVGEYRYKKELTYLKLISNMKKNASEGNKKIINMKIDIMSEEFPEVKTYFNSLIPKKIEKKVIKIDKDAIPEEEYIKMEE